MLLVISLMKLQSATVILVASFGIVAGSASQSRTDYSYEVTDRGSIKIEGVCSVETDRLACWKPAGEADPKLTELINAFFLVSGQRLEMHYKHRTYLIAVRSKSLNYQNPLNSNQLQVDGNAIGQGVNVYMGGQSDLPAMYWFYPSDDATSFVPSVKLDFNAPGVRVPLKVGATAEMQGGSIEITAITKLDAKASQPEVRGPYGNQMKPKPTWLVTYKLLGTGNQPLTGIFAYAYDASGNPVNRVDTKGNPDARPADNMNGYNYNQDGPIVSVYPVGTIRLTVNPEKVGYLMITGTSSRVLTFGPVALQPK